MDDEIDLHDIFRVLWKRRLLIIGVLLVALLVAGVISFAMPSVYRISTIVALGNFDDPVYTSQASVRSVMLSDEFLLEVFEQLHPDATGSKFTSFKNSVKIVPVKDNDNLIVISVETSERQEGLMAIEKIVQLYANRSEDSYNKQKKILTDQLADTQERLDAIYMEINQTSESLQDLQDSSVSSTVQAEMRFSRTLDILNGKETQRNALMDHRRDLQKQLVLIRPQKVVQPVREPISPIGSRTTLILAIAGMLGLIVGIFAAFLREGLWRPTE